jgi:hypothetical protein
MTERLDIVERKIRIVDKNYSQKGTYKFLNRFWLFPKNYMEISYASLKLIKYTLRN